MCFECKDYHMFTDSVSFRFQGINITEDLNGHNISSLVKKA